MSVISKTCSPRRVFSSLDLKKRWTTVSLIDRFEPHVHQNLWMVVRLASLVRGPGWFTKLIECFFAGGQADSWCENCIWLINVLSLCFVLWSWRKVTSIVSCVSFAFLLPFSPDETSFTLASVFQESASCSELITTLRLDLKFCG